MDMRVVGNRIRDFRMNHGLTQEKLAELADVSLTYISVIERGESEIKLKTFVAICRALDVSADDILQDLVPPSSSVKATEFESLFKDQPRDIQRRIVRAVKAAIDDE